MKRYSARGRGGRLALLCLCHPRAHNSNHSDHLSGLMKEVGGRGRLSASDEDGRAKLNVTSVISEPFGPVLPVIGG